MPAVVLPGAGRDAAHRLAIHRQRPPRLRSQLGGKPKTKAGERLIFLDAAR